jgi:hypothetical protein
LKTQEAIKNLGGMFFATHHKTQNLLLQIYTSLESSKTSSVGQDVGVMMRLLSTEEVGQVQNSNWYKREEMLLFLANARLLNFMENMWIHEVCNTSI